MATQASQRSNTLEVPQPTENESQFATDLKRLKERKEALLRSKGYLNNEEDQ